MLIAQESWTNPHPGKKRHVKCDETKPACKNCIKWAGFCGGYEAINTNHKAATIKKAIIALPSPDLEATSSPEEFEIPPSDYFWQFQSSESLSPPASIDSQTSPYAYPSYPAQLAGSYYTPTTSSAVFDDTFWQLTLPQLVQDNTAIRYANLAVQTLIFAKGPASITCGKPNSVCDYYGEALVCYGLALSETRRATAWQTDTRVAVLCCMFFVIFETLNGDKEAAQAHLQSGQRLLGELGPDDFRQELRNVSRYLAQQTGEFAMDGSSHFAGDERCSILESLVF
ncbi:hypothetical protein QQS21_003783 [Conoideocrella luteorostrata]|uniref:Zn(2)-C6 fungal-type domain-containing protein n=1 Tax=Conoideocrella luteorostrata TaxID=1105319 RepID=A0AAJ0CV61_9HYPO|nr:hypothetical protein QQS21_003783 [Conoideocrella luteorostrata]